MGEEDILHSAQASTNYSRLSQPSEEEEEEEEEGGGYPPSYASKTTCYVSKRPRKCQKRPSI